MSLNNILQALEAEAGRQVAEIEHAAQVEIERIRSQTKVKAEVVRQKHMAAIKAPLQAEQTRILNQAKLAAVQIIMGTRETLISSALEATIGRLAEITVTPAYAGLLQYLAQEAVDTLGVDGRLCLQVHSRDVTLTSQIVRELALLATVEGGLESKDASRNRIGGMVMTTSDRRISLDNTLEVRLQRVASLHRAQIARLIFGNEQEV